MPLEIEVKLKVEDHEGVRERLRAIGAERVGKVREVNVFFDRNGGELRAKDCGLRVRFARSLEGGGEGKALITFKGPAEVTGLKVREALDVYCEPEEQVSPLIEALGFERVMSFEKNRETWRVAGCLVELDEMPRFGRFVEVEGPSEEVVQGVQGKLGLGGLKPVEESYSRMAGMWLKEQGGRELQF